jgi:hypothetical protein
MINGPVVQFPALGWDDQHEAIEVCFGPALDDRLELCEQRVKRIRTDRQWHLSDAHAAMQTQHAIDSALQRTPHQASSGEFQDRCRVNFRSALLS